MSGAITYRGEPSSHEWNPADPVPLDDARLDDWMFDRCREYRGELAGVNTPYFVAVQRGVTRDGQTDIRWLLFWPVDEDSLDGDWHVCTVAPYTRCTASSPRKIVLFRDGERIAIGGASFAIERRPDESTVIKLVPLGEQPCAETPLCEQASEF